MTKESKGFEYIRDYYNVPAKLDGRVRYTGDSDEGRLGTITDAGDAMLRIRLDGQPLSKPFHPTWRLEYLQDDA